MPEFSAQDVIAYLRNSATRGVIRAVWVKVGAGRDEFAAQLAHEGSELALVPHVVRRGFSEPNSFANDITAVLNESKSLFTEELSLRAVEQGQVILVLLGRRELGVPDFASPLILPSWFPLKPGSDQQVQVAEVTFDIHVPLNHRLMALSQALFTLEGVLIDRLLAIHGSDRRKTMSFLDRIADGDSHADLLRLVQEGHGEVSTPASFRPNAQARKSLVGRIWKLVSGSTPAQINTVGKALITALAISEQQLLGKRPPFMGIWYRPAGPDLALIDKWGRGIAISIWAQCQLITVAAHADEYDAYPAILLESTVHDFQNGLENIADLFNS